MRFEDAHALVIGISDAYAHLPRLRRSHDPQDLAAVLAEPLTCGYPPENVRLLLEERATRRTLLEELDALAARVSPRSSVLVYFSGHGARGRATDEERYRHYLMPVDARNETMEELEETAISCRELSARLAAIPAARLTVLLDCCRAAALTGDLRLPPLQRQAELLAGDRARSHGRGRVVLASSRGEEYSYVPRPGERNSAFTAALLRGLRGAVESPDGVVRICDLYHFLQRQVSAESPLQHPVFRGELEENYPIARRPAAAAAA